MPLFSSDRLTNPCSCVTVIYRCFLYIKKQESFFFVSFETDLTNKCCYVKGFLYSVVNDIPVLWADEQEKKEPVFITKRIIFLSEKQNSLTKPIFNWFGFFFITRWNYLENIYLLITFNMSSKDIRVQRDSWYIIPNSLSVVWFWK